MAMWMFSRTHSSAFSQQMDQLRIRWLLSQMTSTGNFIPVCSINFFGLSSSTPTSCNSPPTSWTPVKSKPFALLSQFCFGLPTPVARSYHPYFFFQQLPRQSRPGSNPMRRNGLPVSGFWAPSTCLPFHLCSLQTLLASPADQRHLVKSRHFNQEYLLDPCPPWSAGMWTQINSTLETLKVEWSECLLW